LLTHDQQAATQDSTTRTGTQARYIITGSKHVQILYDYFELNA